MRYARQIVFPGIGQDGQRKLAESTVAIVGLGALGTVSANVLCRAGVGHLRLIDRDYVELTNLQRQLLYDEEDAEKRLPKAVAACNHLGRVNSEIVLEPMVVELNSSNIESIFKNVDLVLDGLDHWDTRFLLNEACHKLGIPWIYTAALGSEAMSMNILPNTLPGEAHPCLCCFMSPESGSTVGQSCATAGVLNMATGMIAAIQAAEAVKILVGSPEIRHGLFTADLWNNRFKTLQFEKDADCPVCVHDRYEYLNRTENSGVTRLCGGDSIQVLPSSPIQLDLEAIAVRLAKTLKADRITVHPFMLTFDDGSYRIQLFQDGRAIIENARDETNAKSIYAEYVGG